MPQPINKLSQFWQELKRRKVARVITVYAAAAFVILELTDIVAPSLRLPEWTMNLILVLLIVGFIIAVILSWIYDVHSEKGIVKTAPAQKATEAQAPPSSKSWKIASYISFVVIVGLIVMNVVPRSGKKEILDKSIAVLPFLDKSIAVRPFKSLSDDLEKQYLADGVMDAILLDLSKIKDLRVLSNTSVEQYRETDKTASEICKELDVAYLLEGSFQKYGDQARLIVQLIESGKEDHVWAEKYDKNWEDIFSVQSEVAQSIAKEIQAFITPEEKLLIEKEPTKNLEAYDYYLLGQHYLSNFYQDDDLWKAIAYYQQALDLDSTYALAYSGIAFVYLNLNSSALLSPNEAYPKAKAYAMKALELNEELSNAHYLLGSIKKNFEYDFAGAEREYIRALEISPNSHHAHIFYAEYLSLMGRHDDAISHAELAFTLDPLTATMFFKSRILFYAGYRSEALRLAEETRDSDPDNPRSYWWCAVFYTYLGLYNEALSMLQTQMTLMGNDNISDEIGFLGYIYGRLGQKDKAHKQLDRLDELSSKGFYVSPRTRLRIYIGLNNLDKAIEILEQSFEDHSMSPSLLRTYPDENLLNDPRFIKLQEKVGLRK